MWENLDFDKVIEYARDPYTSIRAWKGETGKKVVGSTLADVPEEVNLCLRYTPGYSSGHA